MFALCRDQYQRRVPVTTFTLRVRTHVIVFPVHIGNDGAVLTVVIRSLVTSKLIPRRKLIFIITIIFVIIILLLAGF